MNGRGLWQAAPVTEDQEQAPRVTLISTTPLKGCRLHHPSSIDVDRGGARGDRDFFFVDDRHKLLSITRTGTLTDWWAECPDGATLTLRSRDGRTVTGPVEPGAPLVADFFGDRSVPSRFVDGPWNELVSGLVGRPVRLVKVKEPGDGHDVHALSVVSEASLAEISRQAGADVDARRFRMLLQVDGLGAHEEDDWRDREVVVGTARLRMGGPVPRCNATTRDPDTGVTDLRTLHLLNDYRGRQRNEFGDGLNFGVYASVVEPGTISVGDALQRVR